MSSVFVSSPPKTVGWEGMAVLSYFFSRRGWTTLQIDSTVNSSPPKEICPVNYDDRGDHSAQQRLHDTWLRATNSIRGRPNQAAYWIEASLALVVHASSTGSAAKRTNWGGSKGSRETGPRSHDTWLTSGKIYCANLYKTSVMLGLSTKWAW